VRLVGVKNAPPAELETLAGPDGKPHPGVVLDLDYTVLMPRRGPT
jgi:2-methylfumaryl-CoA hydratase